MLHSVFYLKEYLNSFRYYCIKARGPLAGWIALKSIDRKCTDFLVQARGLIAIEYEMHLKNKNVLHKLREKVFSQIEQEIYRPKKAPNNFIIESISAALSDYLVQNYKANQNNIKLANFDVPAKIDTQQIEIWKHEIRKVLNIDLNTHVYCYNGSAKPWQDIDLTIEFFQSKLNENNKVFLLVLTQDKIIFDQALVAANIDDSKYKVISVKHNEIYKYLSACDTGLLFRKKHLANWISRPIKAMEYQAVGLNILHNNTVKWLIDQF